MDEINQYNYGDKVTFTPCSLKAARWMRIFSGKITGERARIDFMMPTEKWEAMDFRKAAREAGYRIEIHLF